MADDLDAMARKLEDLARSLDDPRLNRNVGDLARRDMLAELDGDRPGRRFPRWGVTMDVSVEPAGDTTRIVPTPAAPWKVLDEGRSPGSNGNVAWGPTVGKGTWRAGAGRVADESPKRVDDEVQTILHRIY
jgi:hypothetical protein